MKYSFVSFFARPLSRRERVRERDCTTLGICDIPHPVLHNDIKSFCNPKGEGEGACI